MISPMVRPCSVPCTVTICRPLTGRDHFTLWMVAGPLACAAGVLGCVVDPPPPADRLAWLWLGRIRWRRIAHERMLSRLHPFSAGHFWPSALVIFGQRATARITGPIKG